MHASLHGGESELADLSITVRAIVAFHRTSVSIFPRGGVKVV